MSFFLPSDLGRLIYGYLQTSCSERLAEEFLNTSDSMKECRKYRHIGFDARVHDRTLTQMLNEYSLLSDLIFENCNESDRSHINIVNKLQNLLKSRAQSSRGSVPTDTIPSQTSKESNYTSGEPVTNSFTHVLSDTLNAFQEEDSTHGLQSPSKCSNSSPVKSTTSVSCTVAVIPDRETPAVDNALSKNSPSVTCTNVPINEEHLSGTANPNTIVYSESSSQYRSSPIFGIARSTPTPEKVKTARTSSPVKLTKKSEENQCNSVTSNACSPRLLSPVSDSTPITVSTSHSSPVQNFPQDMEIDGASPRLHIPVFSIPKTPIKSDIIRERKSSDKLVTPVKKCTNDRSVEPSIGNDPVSLINPKGIRSERISVRHSPKQHERVKMGFAAETCAKSLKTENSPVVLQLPKPLVKILPKIQPKPSKDYSSTKNKNSIFTRPSCFGPVPWDYALRQSLNDGTDNPDNSNDVPKKECKKSKRKDRDIVATNLKADSNKRKHDRNSIVCKKKKKLEEARKRNEAKKENIAGKCVDTSKRVSQEGADSSGIISDSNIENTKQVVENILETQTSEGVDQPSSKEPTPSEPNICDVKEQDDFLSRLEIGEEIVLLYKVSENSDLPIGTEC